MKALDKLPLELVISLYQQKINAEKSGDMQVLAKLEKNYPDLFSVEFEDFVCNLKSTVEYIKYKHDQDFQELIETIQITHH